MIMLPTETTRHPYDPDYAVPPGETLKETMEARGIAKSVLANATGLPEKYVDRIIAGHAAITHSIAVRLESVTGVPAAMWDSLEQNYREQLARIEKKEIKP